MLKIGVGIDTLVEGSETILSLIEALVDLNEVDIFFHHHLPAFILETSQIKIKVKEAHELLVEEVDIYLSTEEGWVDELQKLGVFTGYINPKSSEFQLAFDHQIFKDETIYEVLIKWISLIGIMQKQHDIPMKVVLVSNRGSHILRDVKVLFNKLGCEINDLCFLATGGKDEVFRFFKPCLYFASQKRVVIHTSIGGEPLLFI